MKTHDDSSKKDKNIIIVEDFNYPEISDRSRIQSNKNLDKFSKHMHELA